MSMVNQYNNYLDELYLNQKKMFPYHRSRAGVRSFSSIILSSKVLLKKKDTMFY